MSDLTDFLLARIAEDDAAARDAKVWMENNQPTPGSSFAPMPMDFEGSPFDPARVLAECEAKRRMMEFVLDAADAIEGEWGCGHSRDELQSGMEDARRRSDGARRPIPGGCHGVDEYRRGLSILAAVYADHPDYREEWRP